MSLRPEKHHVFPQDTGISAVDLTALAKTQSKVFSWTPGLIIQGALVVSVTAGTGGVGEISLTPYDSKGAVINPFAGPDVDIVTALSFNANNVVYFILGAGISAGVVGTGTIQAAADFLVGFSKFSLSLDVSTAHTGGAATASLHLVFLK